ncbi:MAG: DUF3291 domain-containing protein [Pseudonocardiaceae bacterium]
MWELAQVNVAVMRAPLSDPSMAAFVAAFDPVARLAEESPGFVWHLRSTSGHTVVTGENGIDQVVNLSVWRNYENLHEFIYRSNHGQLLLRRKRWFLSMPQPSTALWWVPAGERPRLDQALARLRHLRIYGPSPRAFSLLRRFTADGHRVQGYRGR